MLALTIPETELFDENTNEFFYVKSQKLSLEHSLVSISKWEEKWHKPFISKVDKTVEETIDYVKCMTITQNVDPLVYKCLTNPMIETVKNYINEPMTATWFSDGKKSSCNSEVVTAELIYYWMIALQIPFECRKWHLNKLLTLIQVCSIKQAPKKKMSKSEIMKQNRAINNARKTSMHTRG